MFQKELYQQLRDAINVCKDYHTKGQGDFWGEKMCY